MNEGDPVVVTNLDDSTAEGTFIEDTGQTAAEYELPFEVRGGPPTLAEYWFGEVEPDEQVFLVELGDKEYAYPASKVEEVEGE